MFALTSLMLVVALAPQDPNAPLATFKLLGKDAVVTRTDVALEMAFNLQRQDRGKQTLTQLVDTTLTRQAAIEKGVMPTADEARQVWQKLQEELRASGRRPEEFATVRNTDEQQWLDDIAVQMAQERLVRQELGLSKDEQVSGDMLKLWLQERKKHTHLVTDPDSLPIGTVARVGTTDLALLDLGFLLLRTSEDSERDRYIDQVAYLATIEAIARDAGITISPHDLDAAVQRRRDDAASDPRFQGMTLDRMLEAIGLTVSALREQRVFRSTILLDKLTQQRFPDTELRADLAAHRQQVLDRVGPRRHLAIIYARALDEPNALVKDDFASAKKRLEAARQRLQRDDFAAVASIESDHGPSKANGGDIGWHRAVSNVLPPPVVAAAFALEVGAVSQPVRTDEGWYLVKVLEAEPVPDDDVLLTRLRALRGQELQAQLLKDADVKLVDTKSGAGK